MADKGIGILKEELNLIWKPFFKSNHKFSQQLNPNGKGLSLSICRKIALELKGSLSVESVSGNGSTFTLSLPYVRVMSASLPDPISTQQVSNENVLPNQLIVDNDG